MPTALAIADGVFAPISVDHTAFAPLSVAGGMPANKDHEINYWESYFKIYTGLDHGKNLGDSGGDLPDIKMFDYYGEYIGGAADPGEWLAPGSSAIVRVDDKDKRSRQSIYTLFTANNNAICVSLVTTSFAGLGGQYAWLGDLASGCIGDNEMMGSWYFGAIVVPGTNHYPNCLWIDKNGGQPATAFQVNWPELVPAKDDDRIGKKVQKAGICQTPSFYIYQRHNPKELFYNNPKVDSHGRPVEKRTTAATAAAAASLRFQRKYGNLLVIDDLDAHRAHDLCESKSSAGPSFLNPKDGFFCEMETKTVYPVCPFQNHTTACFDIEQNQLAGPGMQKRSVPYEVQDWRINRGQWSTINVE